MRCKLLIIIFLIIPAEELFSDWYAPPSIFEQYIGGGKFFVGEVISIDSNIVVNPEHEPEYRLIQFKVYETFNGLGQKKFIELKMLGSYIRSFRSYKENKKYLIPASYSFKKELFSINHLPVVEESTEEYNKSIKLLRKFDTYKNGYYKFHTIYNHIIAEGSIKDSIQEGKWIIYHIWDSTVKYIKNYKKGKLDGQYIEYDHEGKIKFKGQYQNELKHGLWTEFDYIGEIKEKGKYEAGRKTGTWYYYDMIGTKINIEKKVEYKDGFRQNEIITHNNKIVERTKFYCDSAMYQSLFGRKGIELVMQEKEIFDKSEELISTENLWSYNARSMSLHMPSHNKGTPDFIGYKKNFKNGKLETEGMVLVFEKKYHQMKTPIMKFGSWIVYDEQGDVKRIDYYREPGIRERSKIMKKFE